MMLRMIAIAALFAGLAACGGERTLHRFDGTGAPDDFSVLPAHPLAIPPVLDLPQPTPGGVNRADRNPLAEGIAALGGTAGAGAQGDAALIAAVTRNGVEADIRATLAAEDAAFRSRALNLSGPNLLGRDRYFQAYARQALDAQAELARFRAAGVATPSAPPRD